MAREASTGTINNRFTPPKRSGLRRIFVFSTLSTRPDHRKVCDRSRQEEYWNGLYRVWTLKSAAAGCSRAPKGVEHPLVLTGTHRKDILYDIMRP